jgi:Homeodomain-like domain
MPNTPSGEPHRASGSAPSKSKTSAEDLVRVTRDAKIIDLRRDGHTYIQIGVLVGVPKSTVADAVKRWMAEHGPASEQVEELRQFQGAQLDAYQAKLAPHLMRPLRNEDGEILYDGNGDDRRPIEVPDVQVGQLWLRVLERRAKLFGLDMPQGVYTPQVTAEMMAAFFFDENDSQYMGDAPIEVEAEEVDEDREALGRGSDD